MLESCMRPDLVVEITLQPVRRYGVDAAIFFTDIVLPLKAVGVDLDIVPGVGPVVADPVAHARRPRGDPATSTPEHVAVRHRGGRRRWSASSARTPLIGFAGAPFTARVVPRRGRAVQGPRQDQGDDVRRPGRVGRADGAARRHRRRRSSRSRSRPAPPPSSCSTRGPARCRRPTTARYVHAALGRRSSTAVGDLGVPRIHFGVGTGELLGLMGEAGADVVGVDWRVPLADGGRRVGRPGGAGQPRPGAGLRADRGDARARAAEVARRRAAPRRATSSTSATACCPRPTPTSSPG